MTRFALILQAAIILVAGCAAGNYTCKVEADRVTMNLKLPDAENVCFASSLNGFQVRPAVRVGRNRWMVEAPADRQFKYFFIVDGSVYLPDCRYTEDDDFGSRNCLHLPGL